MSIKQGNNIAIMSIYRIHFREKLQFQQFYNPITITALEIYYNNYSFNFNFSNRYKFIFLIIICSSNEIFNNYFCFSFSGSLLL